MSWSDIPGWMAFGPTYDEMIAICPEGGTIVEIGVAFGRSVAYLARKAMDAGKNVKIYAVDPWWDDWWMVPEQYPTTIERPTWGGEFSQLGRDLGGPFSAFTQLMLQHAPEEFERINVLRCKSSDAAKFIGRCHGVMIDGNHNYESVAQDIALWRPHMMPGGILAGDDWSEADFPGVCQAVREAFGEGKFEVRGTTWVVRT
jgi:methyltransferase family protein